MQPQTSNLPITVCVKRNKEHVEHDAQAQRFDGEKTWPAHDRFFEGSTTALKKKKKKKKSFAKKDAPPLI